MTEDSTKRKLFLQSLLEETGFLARNTDLLRQLALVATELQQENEELRAQKQAATKSSEAAILKLAARLDAQISQATSRTDGLSVE
jgi:hypothetical protein